MQLSTNFSLKEFTNSETAARKGYLEQYKPAENIVENLRKLAVNIAEPIRIEFGSFSPTVAYRCERLNKAVKGATHSEHLRGQAFDETFIKDGKNISNEVFFWLLKSKLKWSKLIWEKGTKECPNWLHIGYDENNLKNEVLVFDGKGYVNYFVSDLRAYHAKTGRV